MSGGQFLSINDKENSLKIKVPRLSSHTFGWSFNFSVSYLYILENQETDSEGKMALISFEISPSTKGSIRHVRMAENVDLYLQAQNNFDD